MEKIKIFNKRTFIKRLYNYLGLSVVVLGTYACSLQISELFRDRGFDKRTRIVEKAVSNGEIELASVLLDSFGEKGLLRLEDKIILNQQIERNKDRYEINNQKLRNINRLEGFLTIKNLDSAYVALKQITSTGLFNSGEISDLQNKIYQHTQQGFFEKLASSADREMRYKLSEEYLRLFPDGIHREDVIGEVFVYHFNALIDLLSESKDATTFDKLYGQINKLNSLAVKYYKEDPSLSDLLKFSDLNDLANKYIVNQNDKIKVGITVEYIPVSKAESGYRNEQYLKERHIMFLPGSVGKVIAIDRDNNILVRFDENKNYKWLTDWALLSEYRDDKNSIALYHANELKLVSSFNEYQKRIILREIDRLYENLGNK